MQAAARTRRNKKIGITVAVICIVAAVGIAAAVVLNLPSGFAYDPSAQSGMAPGKTPEEIQAELDRSVEEGMFDISIAGTIPFDTPTSPGTANIENVPGNHYDMQVTLTLDADGSTLYTSGPLAPGTWIESITLEQTLSPGIHKATALFEALDTTTHEVAGSAAAQIDLSIGEGG